MEYVKSFNDFKYGNFNRPDFFWSESTRCLKISEDFFLFVDQQVVVEKKQFEDKEKLNELFGIDFSSFLPNTVSDWVHLGVDGVSALVNFIPGVGPAISVVLDIIHSISYFIEGSIKKNEETIGLYLCGAITGLLPFISAPGIRNAIGSVVKKVVSALGKGSFFKLLLSLTVKLPKNIFNKLLSFLFKLDFLKNGMAKIIAKHEGSWWFKALAKVPVVKQIINFVRNDLGKVLLKTNQILVKELDLYKLTLKNELPKIYALSYKSLDKNLTAFIDEKTFVQANMKLAEERLAKITKSSFTEAFNPFAKYGNKLFKDGLKDETSAIITKIGTTISKEVDEKLADQGLKKLIANRVKKESFEYALKSGDNAIPYNQMIKKSMIGLGKETLLKLPIALLKRFGISSIKNAIAEPITTTQETKPDVNKDETSVSNTEPEKEIVDTEESNFSDLMERYDLKVGVVDNLVDLGTLNLEFRTPDRTRNEDDDSGKLILSGDVFNTINLTDLITDYESSEDLLNDLKLIGKKSENRDELRERDTKKWQRCSVRSTPVVKEIGSRFEFYFLIRERSKISLFKKNHKESIDLPVFLKDVSDKGHLELNGSLYLIAKKIDV